jgi:DNA-binding NtrC family response regulator
MAEILLIDDDEHLPILQSGLAAQGHTVRGLDRADGAMEIMANGEFELVVVDEIMPGLHGVHQVPARPGQRCPGHPDDWPRHALAHRADETTGRLGGWQAGSGKQ